MATAVTHVFFSLTLGKTFTRGEVSWRFWLFTITCAVLPDVDVLGFLFGVHYGDTFGHRGFFHSLFFAFLLSVFLWWNLKENNKFSSLKYLIFFFFIVSAHDALDALTDGGLGVAFFSPFVTTRYFFPWTPLRVSPIGLRGFFSPWGREVLFSEMTWVWIPSILLLAVVRAGQRIFPKGS